MNKLVAAASTLAMYLAVFGSTVWAADTTTPLLPAVMTIHIKNFMFVPVSATIHAGDRVTFVNDDTEAHTATSPDATFDSEGLDSGQAWQHVFAKPGSFNYFCELHPSMKATITVLPASAGAPRTSSTP